MSDHNREIPKIVNPRNLFTGSLLRLTGHTLVVNNGVEQKNIDIEIAIRPPGVRAIIVSGDKILLTREMRHEHGAWDYRLPGGKVFDTFKEFEPFMNDKEELSRQAVQAVRKEVKEETGIVANDVKALCIAKAGSSVVWDLHYFEVRDFAESVGGQQLEIGENINVEWKTPKEVFNLIMAGKMKEDRSVSVLIQYLFNKKLLQIKD